MILLDYIANSGLRLPHEDSSTASLWQSIRAAAGRVGVKVVFPNRDQETIYDDHTPFLQQRVRAVDLIDFSYPYAHKLSDTPDKLSRALSRRGRRDGGRLPAAPLMPLPPQRMFDGCTVARLIGSF